MTKKAVLDLGVAAYLVLLFYVLLLMVGAIDAGFGGTALGPAIRTAINICGVLSALFAIYLLAQMIHHRNWYWLLATVASGVFVFPFYYFAAERNRDAVQHGAAVLRTSILVALAAAAGAGVSAVVAGSRLQAPAPADIPDSALAVPHERVTFPSASGSLIHGWFVHGAEGGGVVVLMHGIRANRLVMVGRAEFLNRAGYSVLLFDFQGHGESPGQHITLGYLEARDAAAAVAYAGSRKPGESISAIGVSLGGAATLLGPEPLPVRALVLEAVYPRIQEAVKNRLEVRVGPLAHLLTPLLFVQLRLRLGITVEDLSPKDRIGNVVAPVLVIAGAEDRYTTVRDSEALFEAAPQPKSLWVIPGAAHVDFAAHSPREYQARVLAFLGKYR